MNKKNSKNKTNIKDKRERNNSINTQLERHNHVNNTQKHNKNAKI